MVYCIVTLFVVEGGFKQIELEIGNQKILHKLRKIFDENISWMRTNIEHTKDTKL